MFKTKKFMVFFLIVLMGIAFCQAAEESKAGKTKETIVIEESSEEKAASAKPKVKDSWFGFGFVSPVQFPDEKTRVTSFRLSAIYTYNEGVNGFDGGFLCDSGYGGVKGLQFAFANRTAGTMDGLTVGFINIAEFEMHGMQLGGFYNQAGSDSLDNAGGNYTHSKGFQLGFVNAADSIFRGFQMGLINISNVLFNGLQIGFVNYSEQPSSILAEFQSKEFKEEQKKCSSVQIGFINFHSSGIFPITLLLNYSKGDD